MRIYTGLLLTALGWLSSGGQQLADSGVAAGVLVVRRCAAVEVCWGLHRRLGDNQRAFDNLGTSLLHNPKNARTLLATGSIIQVCVCVCI